MSSPLKEMSLNLPVAPATAKPNPPKSPDRMTEDERLMLELAGKPVGSSTQQGSLQNSFAKFRAQRAKAKKLARANKAAAAKTPKTQEQKDALRKKFLEQCEKYMGVPYHPSYHKDPSSPYHNAPLYLDCCGLTRRALQDLSTDFGFLIGPGNQAYQFETCPVELTEEQLRPGDLVFTEGTYFKEGKTQQKHNMVHVEVFCGNEEHPLRTIGARRQTGAIEYHDSYKFTSKNYEITKYYFRSLDTWLSGVCKPLIDPAYWEKKFATSNKHLDDTPDGRSVFDACDDDDDDDDAVDENLDSSKKYFYVNQSNGYKIVTDALEKRGYTRLPFEYSFRTTFDLKWVEGRSAINYAAHKPGQLVNHLPNNDVMTNKIGLLTTLQNHYGTAFPPAYFPMTYRLDRPADVLAMLEATKDGESHWIHKPAGKNCGKGIELLKSAALPSLVEKPAAEDDAEGGAEKAEEGVINSRYSTFNLTNGLVQSYITNPLLLNGKKFDVRVYALIARAAPKAVVFFHPGYVRLSLEDFTMDDGKLEDKFIHLTNASVQKKHPEYKERKLESIWSMKQLGEHLVAQGKGSVADDIVKDIENKFASIVNDVHIAALPKLTKKFGFFDLLGFDFMITDDLDVKLLEVNTNPALHLDCPVMEEVIPNVVDNALGLVLKAHETGSMVEEVEDKDIAVKSGVDIVKEEESLGKFQLLIDEATGFVWNGQGEGKLLTPRGAGMEAVKALRKE